MSSFIACFGTPCPHWSSMAQRALTELMGIKQVHEVSTSKGSLLLYGGREEFPLSVHVQDNGGWAVLQGVTVDVASTDGRPRLNDFLKQTLSSASPEGDRLEGCFALALWDEQRSSGWFFNDHASSLNLYYCQNGDAVYVTTAPTALAKSLSLRLDEYGVQQLLTRGCVLAPTSLFKDMHRVCVGERGHVSRGRVAVRREWMPVQDPSRTTLDESANAFAQIITDRMRRLRVVAADSIGDLTGGLDSRVVNLARQFIGDPVHVMVNGDPSHPDVIVAKQLALNASWSLRNFPHEQSILSRDLRQDLSIRTAGELAFDRISFHRATHALLGEEFDVHFNGSGGELLRYYPWSHELMNIGRRKPADVRATLRYRYLHFGEPPRQLFSQPWYGGFQDRLAQSISDWFALMPDTLTTQQQDALYVWKMTSHSSLWNSSTAAWLPRVSPLLMRGCVDAMVAIPWSQKLTSALQRNVNHWLSPRYAAVRTTYGSPGGQWRLRDGPSVAAQAARQAAYFGSKMVRVWRRKDGLTQYVPPFLTDEFLQFLRPENMLTSNLYSERGLREYTSGTTEQLSGRAIYLSRIATIEHIAQAIR